MVDLGLILSAVDGTVFGPFGVLFTLVGLFLAGKAWLAQLTSEFVMTEKRVLVKVGFVRRRTLELMLGKVESIRVNQSVWGRIFGFGTITVSGLGGTRESFHNIADPLELRWRVQAVASGDYDTAQLHQMAIRRRA